MRCSLHLLIVWAVAHVCHADGMPSDTGRGMIREVLQEVNQNETVQIELLKLCPEAIPDLAEWIYEDYDRSLTKEKVLEEFYRRLDEEIPVTLVALKERRPVGVISLITREAPNLADLENGGVWGGGLHVLERGQGIEELLTKSAALIANRMGYREIHFSFLENEGAETIGQKMKEQDQR